MDAPNTLSFSLVKHIHSLTYSSLFRVKRGAVRISSALATDIQLEFDPLKKSTHAIRQLLKSLETFCIRNFIYENRNHSLFLLSPILLIKLIFYYSYVNIFWFNVCSFYNFFLIVHARISIEIKENKVWQSIDRILILLDEIFK